MADSEQGGLSEEFDERFVEHLAMAEGAEEAKWLLWLRDGIRDRDWKNVGYRAWVLTNEYDQHGALINIIDRKFGPMLREAKDSAE